ncbi:hypothetical protein D3C73_1157760 [compost metagenome]
MIQDRNRVQQTFCIYIVGNSLSCLPKIVCLALAVIQAVGLRNIRIQCIVFLCADSHILELNTEIICRRPQRYGIIACVQMNILQIAQLGEFIP